MDENLVLDCFFRRNVLHHTEADGMGDLEDDENLDDAAWGWAESLEKNLLEALGKEFLSEEEYDDIYAIFKTYKGERSQSILDGIYEVYPENIDWDFDSDTRKAFNKLYDYFLACWRDPAFRRPEAGGVPSERPAVDE